MKFTCFVSALMVAALAGGALQAADEAPVRTLVWARPGTSEMAQTAKNWLEYASTADYAAGKAGKPANAGPDANADLILPDPELLHGVMDILIADDGDIYLACMGEGDPTQANLVHADPDCVIDLAESRMILFGVELSLCVKPTHNV